MNEFLNLPPLRQPRKPAKVKPKMPDWCKQRYILQFKYFVLTLHNDSVS